MGPWSLRPTGSSSRTRKFPRRSPRLAKFGPDSELRPSLTVSVDGVGAYDHVAKAGMWRRTPNSGHGQTCMNLHAFLDDTYASCVPRLLAAYWASWADTLPTSDGMKRAAAVAGLSGCCGGALDALGDHRVASPTAGVLGIRTAVVDVLEKAFFSRSLGA